MNRGPARVELYVNESRAHLRERYSVEPDKGLPRLSTYLTGQDIVLASGGTETKDKAQQGEKRTKDRWASSNSERR